VESRRLSASSARKPVRSSPLAGPALSSGPNQLRRSSSSTPDFAAPHGPPGPRHASRAKSLHTINFNNQAHHEHARTHSSSSQEGSRQKLTKRPQLKVRTSTITPPTPPYNHAHSASTPNISINQPSPLSRINTTDSSPSDDKSWLTFSPFAETPRFTRLALSGQNVVMPLSAKEYQRKRRYTQTSTPNSPASSTRTLPPAAPANPNWRRSRSFTQIDQDILDRNRLARDTVNYGASGYHLPTAKSLHPGRIPSSTRSNSTDSTASDSPHYSIPFAPSVSSGSSVITVVDPAIEAFPGKLPVSLVPRKSQSKSSNHSHHSFLSFPNSLRSFPSRDDEKSIWSTDTTPPRRGHESLDAHAHAPTTDLQVMGDGPVPERKRRKSLTARLIRAFSRKRNPT
jgi:hypothetical protein